MKRLSILALALCALLAFAASSRADNEVITGYYYNVTANDPDAFRETLRGFAKAEKGYVKFFTNERIILRVPSQAVTRLREAMGRLAMIRDERQVRQDISMSMLNLRTSLRVKEKLLSDLYAVFGGSKFKETLAVEKEIGKVIGEVENLKGSINFYSDRVALSDVDVTVSRSGDSTARPSREITRWDWIRRLGINSLVNSF
jgi:hypothetical protein